MWMLGTELGFSARAAMILTTEESLQPLSVWVVLFLKTKGLLMFLCVCICACDCRYPQRPEALNLLRAGVTSSCESPIVGSGNRVQFLCKGSAHS